MNRVLAHTGARYPIDAMLRFVCEAGIRFVTTSAGSPAKFSDH